MTVTLNLPTAPLREGWPQTVITVIVIIIVTAAAWTAYGPSVVVALFTGGALTPVLARYSGITGQGGTR